MKAGKAPLTDLSPEEVEAVQTRYAKSADAKAKVRESILALKPAVLALEEMGTTNALLALRDGELCLCHVVGLLELAPSTVSKHLELLGQAWLVERRKEGRWCYFRLAARSPDPTASPQFSSSRMACLLLWACRTRMWMRFSKPRTRGFR